MSYSDLIKKIKATPLKYIDEYNIDYLQNYLDGYYFFSFRNGFKDGLLIMSWHSLLYYVQTKVIEKGDELVKNELENSC